jgi:hypothetical protein
MSAATPAPRTHEAFRPAAVSQIGPTGLFGGRLCLEFTSFQGNPGRDASFSSSQQDLCVPKVYMFMPKQMPSPRTRDLTIRPNTLGLKVSPEMLQMPSQVAMALSQLGR